MSTVITQEQIDAWPLTDGFKIFPKHSIFGEELRFDKTCRFDSWCSFGKWSIFSGGCRFNSACNFGEGCSFGPGCDFLSGRLSSFGGQSIFSGGCIFNELCNFGEGCSFGPGCKIKDCTILQDTQISIEPIGKDKRRLYAWITDKGWHFKSDYHFDNEDNFLIKVKENYGENSDYERAMEFLKTLYKQNGVVI